MEFWGGKSLRTVLLEDDPPTKSTLIKIFLDAANKLAKLHYREIYFFDMNPDNILLNDNNEVLLSDFEYALRGDLAHFEGWDGGAPGFSPNATIWGTIEAPLKQKLIYKDIFALGNIFLAVIDKKWYLEILQDRLSPFANLDVRSALSKLPKGVQDIYLKTSLLSNERYESTIDLIQDVQGLATYE